MFRRLDIRIRRMILRNRKETMQCYLKLKLAEEDYHGVQDAASDIREIEAAIKEIDVIIEPRQVKDKKETGIARSSRKR